MYVPAHFREDRVPVLHEAIRRIALGTLVTVGADGVEATHVPMLVDREPAPCGRLQGHIARANPQWRRLAAGETPALAIFLGPETYITPSWYATKQQTGKVVPTWNYVAVHAYGALRFIDDAAWLLAQVSRLTATHEAERAEPWRLGDAPTDYVAGMLKGIIGFELTIARLEGKWKMSQNREMQDRVAVVTGLRERGEGEDLAVADEVAYRTESAG
jgi:transcriptional regulator